MDFARHCDRRHPTGTCACWLVKREEPIRPAVMRSFGRSYDTAGPPLNWKSRRRSKSWRCSRAGAHHKATAPPAARRRGRPARRRRRAKALLLRLDPAVHRRLRMLAVERDTTAQALAEEALRLLFERYEG